MSMEELQTRAWVREWKNHPSVVAAAGREGMKDMDYNHYPAIAYEIRIGNEVLARTEGRDALKRIQIVFDNCFNKELLSSDRWIE